MTIPEDVGRVLARLRGAGHEAWCVGGCVRDLLLGKEPQDYDVTTAALPEEVLTLFGEAALPTGLRHGTVTVHTEVRPIEVTTFRRDGAYLDGRHPSEVTFTPSLREDLARRDFTVNAMALGPAGQVVDLWDGQADLRRGILRCVGEPAVRFREDALRIMRCLRFSSVLGFSIEAGTGAALRENRDLLGAIAVERIRVEFEKLLCGKDAAPVLLGYPEVIAVFLPEIAPMVGFDQRSPYHCYTLWEHTVRAVEAAPAEALLRWVMLLHDAGKPDCFFTDAAGVGHFYGHPARSAEMAEVIGRRMKLPNDLRERVVTLVREHDRRIPSTERAVGRALRRLGEETFFQLMEVQRADNLAQVDQSRQGVIRETEALALAMLAAESCFSLGQLAIGGRELLALGYSGPAVGAELERLLDRVVDGKLPNEKEALTAQAERDRGSAKKKA